jgi:hypothetical protein
MIKTPVCTSNRPIRQEKFPLLFQTEKLNFYEKGDSFRYLLQRLLPKTAEQEKYAAALYAAAY